MRPILNAVLSRLACVSGWLEIDAVLKSYPFSSKMKPVMTTSPQYLQNCQITHTAIRTAFVSTLDALLHFALDPDSATNRPMGFMSCFPILNGTAPQIQMECLFRTWQRVSQGLLDQSDPLDQLVLYASYESLAQITGETHSPLLKVVLNGPGRCFPECDHWLHSKTRCLQISRSGATILPGPSV